MRAGLKCKCMRFIRAVVVTVGEKTVRQMWRSEPGNAECTNMENGSDLTLMYNKICTETNVRVYMYKGLTLNRWK